MTDYKYYAFIDVLGYRVQLDADKKSGRTDFLDRLKRSFAVLDNIDNTRFRIRSVSDSIFVFATGTEKGDFIGLLETIKLLFNSFLANALLIRGGIAWDQHFETDRITYSLALVQAHELESKQAVVPRILIANSIIDKARNEKWIHELAEKFLVVSDGGRFQLHVVTDENWDATYRNAKSISIHLDSNEIAPTDVRIKHLWLEDYLFAHKPKNNRAKRYMERWTPLRDEDN